MKCFQGRFFSKSWLLIWFLILATPSYTQTTHNPEQQPPKRELRAAWIATVANIDWPSSKRLDPATQRSEAIRILDNLSQDGFNAVFLQVRSAADAMYAKSSEPWSEWLTAEQGVGPQPFYDPLEFFISEAHKRGMELHAWLNPYRAVFDRHKSSVAGNHITRRNPGWFFPYGKNLLFNPGIPGVRSYIIKIVSGLVRNYDIDGIHFDDYFYPYPEKRSKVDDEATFTQFGASFTTVANWRRNNIDLLVKELHDSIRVIKPWVKFGISPFGVWQNQSTDPQGSDTHGFSTYLNQFADSRKWIREGWVDYINPQIYFATTSSLVPYENLLTWWGQNRGERLVFSGIGAYKVGHYRGAWMDRTQIPLEVSISRQIPGVEGQVYYSARSIENNALGFADSLRNHYYLYPALMPRMPWLDTIPPNSPVGLQYTLSGKGIKLSWNPPPLARDGEGASYFAVYRFDDTQPVDLENPRNLLKIIQGNSYLDNFFSFDRNYFYVVTALDHMQNESLGTANIYVSLKDKDGHR